MSDYSGPHGLWPLRLAMELSRQEYWSGLPCPSSGDLPDPGIEPKYPALQADSLSSETPEKPCEVSIITSISHIREPRLKYLSDFYMLSKGNKITQIITHVSTRGMIEGRTGGQYFLFMNP